MRLVQVSKLLAVAYPLALAAVAFLFRFVGERWWLTTIALYLPRIGFALPLPVVAFLVWRKLPRAWLLSPLFALWLWLGPLMGFQLGHAREPASEAGPVRVLSFNIGRGWEGMPAIANVLKASPADIVCLQECSGYDAADLEGLFADEFNFHVEGQFFLATRYRIEEAYVPPVGPGDRGSSRYVRYRLRTPSGPIHVYNFHSTSPQEAFVGFRGEGLRSELLSGRLFSNTGAIKALEVTTAARVAQVRAAGADIAASTLPALLVGDTNLPTGSWAFASAFGGLKDAFAEVGFGFGYTFPWKRRFRDVPWMRLDRVLGNDKIRFLHYQMPPERASDHLALVVDFEVAK